MPSSPAKAMITAPVFPRWLVSVLGYSVRESDGRVIGRNGEETMAFASQEML